jgi:hypothetical protein
METHKEDDGLTGEKFDVGSTVNPSKDWSRPVPADG